MCDHSELTGSCEIRSITAGELGREEPTRCQDGCCSVAAQCQQATCRHLLQLQPDIMLSHGASNGCCRGVGVGVDRVKESERGGRERGLLLVKT